MRTISLSTLKLLAKSDRTLFEHNMSLIGLRIAGHKSDSLIDKEILPEQVKSLASTITEDINDNVKISKHQSNAKRMAEKLGYIVTVED